MAKSSLPDPLVPADVDLRLYPFTPLFRARLFGSDFDGLANDTEWRAGVTLWLKSWDQVPAGTLPDNDAQLARLAGIDATGWHPIRDMALRGWFKCSDGRLHHRVVAEGVLKAWQSHRLNRENGAAGAAKRWEKKGKRHNGRANGPPNSRANSPPNGGANSNREGDRDRDSSEAKASAQKASSNPSDWLWAEGLSWLLANTARKEGPIRSFIGKCRASLKNDDAKLRQIIEQAMANNPAEPFGWISAAIQSRNPPEPEPAEGDYLTEADHQLVRMFGAIATDVLNFKRSGAWYSFQGPRPDDPASKIDPVILSKHGYADPEIYAGWYRKLNGSAP